MDRAADLADNFVNLAFMYSFQGRASLGMGGVLFFVSKNGQEEGACEGLAQAPE